MIIRSGKDSGYQLFSTSLIVFILGIAFLIGDLPIVATAVLWIICFYIIICAAISYGKTIVLDEKGCTLYLNKYKKTYRWDDFKIKRMEDYRDVYYSPTHQAPYSSFVLFSVKELHKPKNMLPDIYNCYFRPFSFSFFYVYFRVEDMYWNSLIPYPNIYPVDEKEFLEKMQQWGVELEVYNAREERFK